MLFQFAALFLLSFRGGAIDLQALTLAVCLPAATLVTTWLMRRLWPIDEVLLLLVLFLCSVSLVTLQDIARSPQTPREQAVYMLIGMAVMFFAAWFIRRLRRWEKWFWPLMALSTAALALPIALGVSKYGAYNWISIFGVSAQPSEFVKFSLVLVLAIPTIYAGFPLALAAVVGPIVYYVKTRNAACAPHERAFTPEHLRRCLMAIIRREPEGEIAADRAVHLSGAQHISEELPSLEPAVTDIRQIAAPEFAVDAEDVEAETDPMP